MDKLKLLSIAVNLGTYKEFIADIIEHARVRRRGYICVANVHMLIEAYRNAVFSGQVSNAMMIAPDGLPLAWAIRLFYGIRQERVAGMDLLPDLLKAAELNGLPVFIVGGSRSLLNKTSKQLAERFPNLKLAGVHSPPFRQMTTAEEDALIEEINQSEASLILVALGCPKQEKWMAGIYQRMNAPMIGIGGALAVMTGAQKRAPRWMQTAGLEWLHRLFQEPRRLFKRYAVTNTMFLLLCAKAMLARKTLRRKNILGFYS